MRADPVARWRRKAKTGGGHGFWDSLEGNNGETVCETKEGADGTAKRVSYEPDIGIRI